MEKGETTYKVHRPSKAMNSVKYKENWKKRELEVEEVI